MQALTLPVLSSTAKDLARWMELLVAGPVLNDEYRKQMLTVTPQSETYMKAKGADFFAYNKGVGLTLFKFHTDGAGDGWGHDGQIGGFSSGVIYFEQVSTSISLVTNLVNSDVLSGIHMLADTTYP